MTRSTTNYFSNSLCGVPQVAGEYVDLFQISQYPKFPLGQKYEREDGAIFRYAHFGTVGSAGYLFASAATSTTLAYATASTCVAPSSTYQMPDEISGVYPGSIGSRYLNLCVVVTANVFSGATLTIATGAGRGYSYRVRGNTLTGNPATGMTRISLYDQIQVAVDTTSVVTIVGNRYQDLAHANTSHYIQVAGVAMAAPTTAGYYGWVQTQGVASCQLDATPTVGQLMTVSTGTVGAATPCIVYVSNLTANSAAQTAMTLYPIIGYCAAVATVGTQGMIALQLE